MKGVFNSPIGNILIETNNNFITGLNFTDDEKIEISDDLLIKQCSEQLKKYFNGELKNFTLPIKYNSTEFRNKVYDELLKIPYGETISYKQLAEKINNPKAVRAVGGANHNNNISIIVPCHRVIGNDGSLTGYGGGLWRKKWLLDFEKRNSSKL